MRAARVGMEILAEMRARIEPESREFYHSALQEPAPTSLARSQPRYGFAARRDSRACVKVPRRHPPEKGGSMSWLWMFIVGLIVGIVAKFLMPGKDPGGFIITAILGVAGMFLGGWLSSVIFGTAAPGGELQPAGFIGGVIGALILLAIYRLVKRRTG
jgi:uncharacterized membrane protein YeaQ/YmgE (transglycosylase-associated protein family)